MCSFSLDLGFEAVDILLDKAGLDAIANARKHWSTIRKESRESRLEDHSTKILALQKEVDGDRAAYVAAARFVADKSLSSRFK